MYVYGFYSHVTLLKYWTFGKIHSKRQKRVMSVYYKLWGYFLLGYGIWNSQIGSLNMWLKTISNSFCNYLSSTLVSAGNAMVSKINMELMGVRTLIRQPQQWIYNYKLWSFLCRRIIRFFQCLYNQEGKGTFHWGSNHWMEIWTRWREEWNFLTEALRW